MAQNLERRVRELEQRPPTPTAAQRRGLAGFYKDLAEKPGLMDEFYSDVPKENQA